MYKICVCAAFIALGIQHLGFYVCMWTDFDVVEDTVTEVQLCSWDQNDDDGCCPMKGARTREAGSRKGAVYSPGPNFVLFQVEDRCNSVPIVCPLYCRLVLLSDGETTNQDAVMKLS